MIALDKLDSPCREHSRALAEVVVMVSYPFPLVSDRQFDNRPLLVCKPIAHAASRVFSPCSCFNGRRHHYLPLHRTNMRALAATWNPWQTLSINT